MSPRLRRIVYFCLGFFPAWIAEGTKFASTGRVPVSFFEWSIILASAIIPGLTALVAAADKTTST